MQARKTIRAWRAGPIAAFVVSVAVLAAGCGSSSPSRGVASIGSTSSSGTSAAGGTSGGVSSADHAALVKFAQCMRSHGVPNFPDPQSNGMFVNTGKFDSSSPAFQSAEEQCKNLKPAGIAPAQPSPQQQTQFLKFAQCMRSHGVPNFPDPTASGIRLAGTGIDPRSPAVQSARAACRSLRPTPGS